MPVSRHWLLTLSVAVSLLTALPLLAQEGNADQGGAMAEAKPDPTAALWSDFNHYVRIARPDMALAAGTALLKNTDEQKLLDLVENGDYPDWEETLIRAARIDTLKELSKQIGDEVQHARITRSRDSKRIVADIQKLGEGERANMNATARLKAAGQFAVPALLETLLDEKQARLHPYVLAALVAIGRPAVYPLSVALPSLDPVPQGQVAQTLTEIGYPLALPSIKQVIEDPKTDPTARKTAQAAYAQLARAENLPENVTAAELYLTLGQNHYLHGLRGAPPPSTDAAQGGNVVWSYDRLAGLVPVEVAPQVYADVLAMRAARQTLRLNQQMDSALSLWLAANLRRSNRLNGAADLSYGADMLEPSFYIEMAGPLRQHDVLARALDDNDPKLALNAIRALGATAGTDALVNRAGTVQPLIRALSFPDRRVRFSAAFTMSNARPKSEFPGSPRVVPVLAEALRQTDSRSALVIGRDTELVNRLVASIKDMGYQAVGGMSLNEVTSWVNTGPGLDLIVTAAEMDDVVTLHNQTVSDYKLAAVPMIAIVSPGDQIELTRRFDRDASIRTLVKSEKLENLKGAIDAATKAAVGAPISSEEAQQFALASLKCLSDIALSTAGVFNVTDAQPALIEALRSDKRAPVAIAAAGVLALLEQPQAQTAIAEAALDSTRTNEMRIALLGSLADSATLIGNHLNDIETDKLLELVKTSSGDLALAAARAHGALTLPTANVVPMIVK